MDFFKKLFGSNTNQQQDNFIVDENGVAKDVPATHATITPVSQTIPQNNPEPVSAPASLNQVSESNSVPQTNQTFSTNSAEGEFVGDTKAFDELMAQADRSVDLTMPEKQVDPEFQKVKDEIAKEEGIEIFPAE